MSPPGDDEVDLLARSRETLLDALDALSDHIDSLILIGAQAVYLRTGDVDVALPAATKDSDLALDPRTLSDQPLIEEAMMSAGFVRGDQPGAWHDYAEIPIDLMVPELLAGNASKGARGARIAPHSNKAARRAAGLEAAVVDNGEMEIGSLISGSERSVRARVAGPAALLVAKAFKIFERRDSANRLRDKDAHDIYRILAEVDTEALRHSMTLLCSHKISGEVTISALGYLSDLFSTADSLGSRMAGNAEALVGEPEVVSNAVSLLTRDLLESLGFEYSP